MKKIYIVLLFLAWCSILLANEPLSTKNKVDSLIQKVKDKYMPDTREGIFDFDTTLSDNTVYLSGKTTNNSVIDELILYTEKEKNIVVNSLKLLPDKALGDTLYGVINVSVADIRTQNRFTSGMATQALLGTPVKLYDHDNWYQIQLPDSYFGWVHEKQIIPMNRVDFNKWISSLKIIYTQYYGFSYQEANNEGATVSDLVAGDILNYEGTEGDYFKVSYPDKRMAYVLRTECQDYSTWLQSRPVSAENCVEMAKTMMGIPYVWGGASTKGFDCSGLVSNVLYLQGLIIRRDASQQANIGDIVDISTGYDNLRIGDLLFFGTKSTKDQKENVRHVAFYIGEGKFIHASGYVKISSLNANDPDYDELNAKELIKATRIINDQKLKGVTKLEDNPFYDAQK